MDATSESEKSKIGLRPRDNDRGPPVQVSLVSLFSLFPEWKQMGLE